ncbi:MAG: hypothetical protein AMXMBFR64_01000 [Myxococcales bacterium]
MATLADKVTKQPERARVIDDCVALIDSEVAKKGGLSGLAIKGAYKTVKALKPGFIAGVVDALLDEWIAKLEPFYASWAAAGTFEAHLSRQRGPVAEALLEVTDARASRTKHTTAKKLYEKLRPSAKAQVEESVPALAGVMQKYV